MSSSIKSIHIVCIFPLHKEFIVFPSWNDCSASSSYLFTCYWGLILVSKKAKDFDLNKLSCNSLALSVTHLLLVYTWQDDVKYTSIKCIQVDFCKVSSSSSHFIFMHFNSAQQIANTIIHMRMRMRMQ